MEKCNNKSIITTKQYEIHVVYNFICTISSTLHTYNVHINHVYVNPYLRRMEGFLSSSSGEPFSSVVVFKWNGVDDCGCGGGGVPVRLGDDEDIDFLGIDR